ncbi:arginine repressor ArgR [Thermoclostridium stercorarium subsp. stercorarium DSM 8532]|jgi:transcriptional regulator of arginine metabolism|uniref:Arginine repressor n=3 Tax=Thermoclostridium stercorarium TaxID=1510 RepID=L7VRC0_THES1|nr:arginine repressor [Thermoclostridium stercorarium]AGC69204.1 arginine repressor ArgR [Thermoclostridium stercorarium subsp. stercorarium DSM 8532]AGI40174.1 transcriptional regulator [Thermoclostridium stercorarium subsp. stercorarium DSM 8532]ANW99480.1 arginine repressor [Thermoclostridium stercorarium subsp. thermolacticum DSM 2910]ANX02106.1 arginine repressor [Thermoclostridium stercorarium subsp. leptospartum DSM 9219]UZQ85171.1 arginine repressor [Thermoclostridium stercorarium]
MKYNRHAKILEIIENYDIETQDELVAKLKEYGMDVTQATVSRDIKELRLVKVTSPDGKARYKAMSNDSSVISDRLLTILREGYVSSDYANNILVVKTLPGMAQAVASAIDSLGWPEIVGTIAGDDTIMVVTRAERIAEEMQERFTSLLKKGD